jgi:5'-nucleotidase
VSRRPRILLTNDDGVRAPGLKACFERLRELADVTVVAPVDQRSGASHHITLEVPLRAHRLADLPGWMVDFTPVDCVKLALRRLLPEPPDLVVSGINRGSNAGYLVHYSGTVNAATEAVMAGVQAIAVSLCAWEGDEFDAAARVTQALAARLLERPLPPRTVLNVNVPNRPWQELKGLRWCRQSLCAFTDEYEERIDPRRQPYYWLAGAPIPKGSAPDDDLRAVQEGWVAVVPLTVDWTHEQLYMDGGASLIEGLDIGGPGRGEHAAPERPFPGA